MVKCIRLLNEKGGLERYELVFPPPCPPPLPAPRFLALQVRTK